jgi:hypothetical protein
MLTERPHHHAASTRPLSAEAHRIIARDLHDFGITSPEIEETLAMTTDDTRPHPTDAEMDALEAIVHPEGRCAVCGGGKPYWKHTANETDYHPFTPEDPR